MEKTLEDRLIKQKLTLIKGIANSNNQEELNRFILDLAPKLIIKK